MTAWDLLDERSESDLHKTRLLNVEEKPFKRITKRLGSISSAVSNASGAQGGRNGTQPSALVNASSDSLQEDLTLDFAAFDSSIARFQFLHDANQRERDRYTADQQRILAECQAVRANNAALREQLESARATLAQRKKFDELADKITSNRLLRPREDQVVNLAKLEEECKELERESQTYSETWKERRDQFNRIMEEGMMLRRLIRDEKEEVDRREGMNEGGEDDADGDKEGQTPRNAPSDHATPRADGDSQPKVTESDGETPRPVSSSGALTPSRGTPVPDKPKAKSSLSKDATRRLEAQDAPTPSDQAADDEPRDDVDMEDGEQPEREAEEGEGGEEGEDREDGEDGGADGQPADTEDSMEVDE
ncbi:THO complex subunit mft1 [Tolypocladium ophioglossoides CBS 100239]|uniref:THO complex subunit mft1 n=1 Tax=Tolypocladium ophioglossoides (strain CBS 100239) TaxID=1163406 RepID=A0A0L0NM10_TOLOC|nr:THO complex subunit mft1 [Tolypocladium ophioglossoides CBS 100239]